MSFIDQAIITVQAGTGGSGACSFARFKFIPKGGPDGGDGGRGGSIYAVADPNLATLLDYTYRTTWSARRGVHGKGKTMTGAAGEDLTLPVPVGTVLRNADTGEVIGEALEPGVPILVARGGRGGRGNARFATATHQSPREWEPGGEGQTLRLELELKLIADVGLLGEPNAGKSTLLSVITAARPKIGDYPFTTLQPHLGVVALSGSRSFVVADIPGIIEGAHEGKGLGFTFLRHVERTRVLAVLIPLDAEDAQAVYDRLRHEIRLHSESLWLRPHLVLFTKRDLLPVDGPIPELHAPEAAGVLTISAAGQTGLEALVEQLWELVARARAEDAGTSHPDAEFDE